MNLQYMVKTMKEDLRKEFEELSKPLNEWLQKNFSPHHKVVVSFDGAEVVSGEMGVSYDIMD